MTDDSSRGERHVHANEVSGVGQITVVEDHVGT
jgi:hypothetical protein